MAMTTSYIDLYDDLMDDSPVPPPLLIFSICFFSKLDQTIYRPMVKF